MISLQSIMLNLRLLKGRRARLRLLVVVSLVGLYLTASLNVVGLDDHVTGWAIWSVAPSMSTETLKNTPCKLWRIEVKDNAKAEDFRSSLPALIRSLAGAGAPVVVIDVTLGGLQPKVDHDLATAISDAMKTNTRVIVGVDATAVREYTSPSDARTIDYRISPAIARDLGAALTQHIANINLRLKGETLFNQGFNWWRYDLAADTSEGKPMDSLGLAAYRAFGGCSMEWYAVTSRLKLSCRGDQSFDIDAPNGFMIVPQWDPDEFKAMELRAESISKGTTTTRQPLAADVRGNIVLIGYDDPADKHAGSSDTGPASPYGYKHHLNAIAALLNQRYFRLVPWWVDIPTIGTLALLGYWAKRYSSDKPHLSVFVDWVHVCVPLLGMFSLCLFAWFYLIQVGWLMAYNYHLLALVTGYSCAFYECRQS